MLIRYHHFCFPALFIAALLLVPAHVRAEFRLATVDVNRVLNESTESVQKKKSLDELSLQAKKKVETKKQSISELERKTKESKASQDSKEYEALQTEVRNFNRYVKDTEEELRKEFFKINKSLTEKVVTAVRAYAEANDIELVVDKGEKAHGPILFGNPSVDITDEIIKKMNAH